MGSPLESRDRVTCPVCGDENERGNRFCVGCGKVFPGEKKRSRRKLYVLSGVTVLVLAMSVGFFSTGVAEPKLAGKVNGEGITRDEFSKRVDRTKSAYERKFGQSLFQGAVGTENLEQLKAQLFDEMVTERILLQEARRAGYASAPPGEIEKELEAIKQKSGVSNADLERMIGGKLDDLKVELGNRWIISQFVLKVVLKGEQQNGSLVFGQWLEATRARAKIETYEKLVPLSRSTASLGKPQPLDPKIEQDAKTKGLEYYERKTQKKEAEVKVTNYGCHIQVDIVEAGKVVLSLTYRQGRVQEI